MSKILLLFLIQMVLMVESAPGLSYPERTIKKALKTTGKILAREDIKTESLVLNAGSSSYSRNDTVFRLYGSSSDPLGYLIITAARGRFDLMDLMVLYGPDLEVIEVRILIYRSDYGSQVTSKSWLRQFSELPAGEEPVYGENIDALSGATFSASSVTSTLNRLNRQMAELVKK
jgi:hypothetical protein